MFIPFGNLITLPSYRTDGKPGTLVVAEPYKIAAAFFEGDAAERVYWIVNDTPDWSARGGHLHPAGGKREIMVALSGTVLVSLHTAEGICPEVRLDRPDTALLVPNDVWHAVRLSPGAILLSIASTRYAPDEAVTAKPCRCP